MSLNTRAAFGQIGLLPPLCMGAFAPPAAAARRRLGEERGLWWASLVLAAGTVPRVLGTPGLYLGAVVVGAATAVINVLLPVLVRKRFARRRVGTMMGVYALSMGIGSAIVAALVVPVARAVPGRRPGRPRGGRHHPADPPPPAPAVSAERPRVARTAVAWSLTVFFGVQTLAFYTTLARLPSVLVPTGAGQAVLILGFAARRRDQRPHILASVMICVAGCTGLLVGPAGTSMAWVVVLGAGQALPGVLHAHRGADPDHVTALSAMAQTCGFLLAAALHTATGAWTAPLTALIAVLLLCAGASMRAGHDPR
ncbi:MFS transporter [Actinoallomurus acaciae]|uniref:MFS transporter n=1 Tax=Actinoallomurus acaciae TaxID=502577 RepID=A0ABV5YMT4_9ACTN